jgi:hypothetical protein
LILSVGDVHRIHPQDEFIHQVIHLEKPTVTLCLRTDNLPGMNLWSFILPKYKILYKDFDENQSIIFDESEIDGQAMFIFVDKFGNEFVTTRGEMA